MKKSILFFMILVSGGNFVCASSFKDLCKKAVDGRDRSLTEGCLGTERGIENIWNENDLREKAVDGRDRSRTEGCLGTQRDIENIWDENGVLGYIIRIVKVTNFTSRAGLPGSPITTTTKFFYRKPIQFEREESVKPASNLPSGLTRALNPCLVNPDVLAAVVLKKVS